MPTRYLGALVPIRATFTNLAGAVTDPTTVTFRAKAPDETVTAYVYLTAAQVVKESTGIFRFDLACSLPGTYWVRWEGTGAVAATGETAIDVRASRVI